MTDVDPDVVKAIVSLVDGNGWELADFLAERFPVDEFGDPTSKANNGLRDLLRKYEHAVDREAGVKVTGSTLRIYRSCALAWPQDTRVSSAAFGVHLRLRGPDRQAQMAKYVRLAEREKAALSIRRLGRYRSDESSKPAKPYEVRIRMAIANGVRRQMLGGLLTKRADWWMVVTEDERTPAVRELRALAAAIDAGEIKAESDG